MRNSPGPLIHCFTPDVRWPTLRRDCASKLAMLAPAALKL